MAWNLPPLAVTGSTIPAAWGNATRDSLLETAPGQVTDKGQIFWASADGEVSPLAPPSGTGTGYLVINRGTGVVSWGLGTFSTAQIPNLAASKITSGAFDTARIPDLGANKITSGAFSTNRIPNLGADKITFGTFDTGRIPEITSSKIGDDQILRRHIPNDQITEAQLQYPYVSDVGEERLTLDGPAAVDTEIARPSVGSSDEWGMVNFGDASTLAFPDQLLNSADTFSERSAIDGSQGENVNAGQDEWFYVGYSGTFSGIEIDITQGNTHPDSTTFTARYWNGSSWTLLTNIDDGTRADNKILKATGQGAITWDVPTNWAQTAVDGTTLYWMRFNGGGSETFSLVEWASFEVTPTLSSSGRARDGEWRIVRLNDFHDTDIAPTVAVGTDLTVDNSLRFRIGGGIDMFLGVLTGGNLALGTSLAGHNALPFSLKGLWR